MSEIMRFTLVDRKSTGVIAGMGGKNPAGETLTVDNIGFLRNGKRFLPVMGEIHYSRWEEETWEEEVRKMIAGGVNIISFYCPWIHHEEKAGEWDFAGNKSIRRFLEILKENHVYGWYRIGPWAHGELRHGGFPDDVQYDETMVPRSNDPKYLARVKELFARFGEQAKGMFYKDGGPIIGVQLENEYGHCGGPEDRDEQRAHLQMLLKMAKEAGIDAPFYTATAWGGAMVIAETLPVFGGYVDEPWDSGVDRLPPRGNFLFVPYRDDAGVGSDFVKKDGTEDDPHAETVSCAETAGGKPVTSLPAAEKDAAATGTGFFDPAKYPYLTCELGGGLQVTGRRRPVTAPQDTAANVFCAIGSGANLAGYYMYHGGINPDGKYTELHENQTIGGNTNVPRKSYDFQCCINEAGRLNESYGVLKKYHYAFTDFGEQLAGALYAEAEVQPEGPGDAKTLRTALRANPETGAAFLFINNHSRFLSMPEHKLDRGTFLLSNSHPAGKGSGRERTYEVRNLTVRPGGLYIIPLELRTEAGTIHSTNANLLCRLGSRLFLWSDDILNAYVDAEATCTILTESEADRVFKFEDGLYVVGHKDECLIEETDGARVLITPHAETYVKIYRENGLVEEDEYEVDPAEGKVVVTGPAAEEKCGDTLLWRDYELDLTYPEEEAFYRAFLKVDYIGDRAEVFADGHLIDDWFTTGADWYILLDRFDHPERLTIRVYDSANPVPDRNGREVYYELPVAKGCELTGAQMTFEYAYDI